MKRLKERWDIKHNWQLLFPLLGIIALVFASYRLSYLFIKKSNIALNMLLGATFFFILLKLTLFIFSKLEYKWKINHRWELISIFLVFASTGSSSIFVSRPIIKLIGITKENLNPFIYWVLYIIIGFVFYQIMLVLIGWLFGQFKFFWDFEKKMLRRFGLKRLVG